MTKHDALLVACFTLIAALAIVIFFLIERVENTRAELILLIEKITEDRISRSEVQEWRDALDEEAQSHLPSARVPELPVHSPPFIK